VSSLTKNGPANTKIETLRPTTARPSARDSCASFGSVASFVSGIALGVVIGAGLTYAALEKPWEGEPTAEVEAVSDAGPGEELSAKKKGKKRKRRGRGGKGDAELQVIDERIVLTAADRKMMWKGPKVARPDKNMDFSEGGGGRVLNQGEIGDGVNSGQKRVVSCIAEARGQAELAANITLKFLVEAEGKVNKIRVQAPSYLFKQGLYPCIGSAVRSMRFPGTGAATVVTVPFDLSF